MTHEERLLHILSSAVTDLRLHRIESERHCCQERHRPATKHDLDQLKCIMASYSEALKAYSDAVNTAFDSIGESVDGIVAAQNGIASDVAFLKDTIDKLQNSAGAVTPEDQALIDALQARANQTQSRVASVKDSLAQLDAQTEEPPATPPATP